jgi:hypothetical protein
MRPKEKVRNILFILLGVIILVLQQNYSGRYVEIVKSYAGNLSVSFAIYFLISIVADKWKNNKLITAGISLIIVTSFEVTNGFGVMENVFDPIDLFVNLIGIILALLLDHLLQISNSKSLIK